MICNVLEYLEASARRRPEGIAVADAGRRLSYGELLRDARRAGSALIAMGVMRRPVGVYMEKGIDAIRAMLGVVCAGGFYSILNPELPEARLRSVQDVLRAPVIVADEALIDRARALFPEAELRTVESLLATDEDAEALARVRARAIDADPVYVNFTSGSTGVPKGIVVAHRSILDFIDCFTERFDIVESDVIANQAPFDFDVSVKDIYSALRTGATLLIVPRQLFSVPAKLIDYLCDGGATVLIWAVSALCLLSTFHALDYKTPETVRAVLFSGEVMPAKHLRVWREHLPNAAFVNLYGPTEITCNCTYHVLDPARDYADGIPIGDPFPNEDVFLLDEADRLVEVPGVPGEICVRGTALALGYYAAPDQTSARFTQNPLNAAWHDRIYRTGDLGRYDANGEMFFCGRRDFQVKYMGHRIELEEIERAMSAVEGVERCCCTFDEKKSRLKGYYVGAIDRTELHRRLSAALPVFMVPGTLRQVPEMPLTKNGKIDRRKLEEQAGGRP